MPVRASIEPLLWENTFFGVNSGIVRIDASAPELTPEALQAWQRVQVKVPAENIAWLSALQSLGFSLVEGEVDFALPVKGHRDQHGAEIAHLTDIPALRQLAGEAFTQSRFRAPWYAPDASARFYAQWIENAVRGTFDHQCLVLRTETGAIRGYVSLRELNDTDARIGLLADAARERNLCRRRSVGRRVAAKQHCGWRPSWATPPRLNVTYKAVPTSKALRTGYTGDNMIPFNAPPVVGTELEYMQSAMSSGKLCGDGGFTRRCQQWLEQHFGSAKVLLTPSCTASLEMAALLLDIQPGDEVIMPSFTFVSTANAFVLRGAKIVFVDIRPDTMNIDETLIEAAITDKTRAIVPVHYAGVACEMDVIMALADKYNLFVVEDAAQGVMSTYKGRALGTIGHIGCFSFHETKNYTAGGEGGATLINDRTLIERAEIIREKGTNRSQFFRGQVDKYTWRDIGSSYLMSDLQAAYLWAQLEAADRINQQRLSLWQTYYDALTPLARAGRIELPSIPENCGHNAHMFYIKLRDIADRSALINFLKEAEIMAVFHYIPLHDCPAGDKFGEFIGDDVYTTKESERLLRLPLFYNLAPVDQRTVITTLLNYFS